MTPTIKNRLAQLGPVGHCVVTALALTTVFAIACPVAYSVFGAMGVVAAGFAAMVVFFAALTGILLDSLFCQSRRAQFRGTAPSQAAQNQEVLWRMLIGMSTRLALPLASCLVVQLSGGPLASAGFAYFVLMFYFSALFLETWSLVGRQGVAQQG